MTEPIVFSRQRSNQLADMVHKLITVQKMLASHNTMQAQAVKLFNGYQLMAVYFKMSEYDRIIRLHDQELADPIKQLRDRKDLGESQNHILHIESILADSLMMTAAFKRANKVFYGLCKYYN